MANKRFPFDCQGCKYYRYDMIADDWTNICDYMHRRVDDWDSDKMWCYCALPKHERKIRKMPTFIKLTPTNDVYKTVFVNCKAIESVYDKNGDGAHVNFVGVEHSSLEVAESAQTVVDLINRAKKMKELQ